MNILIPNSWLREFLETNATPKQFATAMSLASVSIEKMETVGDDVVFDIEVTTNRPDLMSVAGIAKEASAVLPEQGYTARFKPLGATRTFKTVSQTPQLTIQSDKTLVNRILAVILEIELGPSPKIVTDRLTKTGIRSINNVVDITNYIMRQMGHPSHVFDYDRLLNHTLIIRKSKKGEKIVTLDEKEYQLPGNDIVADNGHGEIVDLLGIMGTANSVVTNNTKRIVLFLDNNNPVLLRKTSMTLGIRTEAAVLNEKGVDPECMMPTLLAGIELLHKNAKAKIISPIIDIYHNKPAKRTIRMNKALIDAIIGVTIPEKTTVEILQHLDFGVKVDGTKLIIEVPTSRADDVQIPEDIVEEVARVYGYHKIPNNLPVFTSQDYYHQDKNEFFWTQKVKEAMRFWGFAEVYTYSLVSEESFEGPIENAIKLKNPLTQDRVYLRNALIPGILEVSSSNKNKKEQQLFEISNVYIKKKGTLPNEVLHFAGLIKREGTSFYDGKGVVVQLMEILGIQHVGFVKKDDGINGAIIIHEGNNIGTIESESGVTFELDFSYLLKHATAAKKYIEPAKFPPIIEDVRIEIAPHYPFAKVAKSIQETSPLVYDVVLLDVYNDKKTFRITFLDRTRNLTNEDIGPIREKIFSLLVQNFKAKIG